MHTKCTCQISENCIIILFIYFSNCVPQKGGLHNAAGSSCTNTQTLKNQVIQQLMKEFTL